MPFDKSSSLGAAGLGTRKFRKIDTLLPVGVSVRQDCGEKAVGPRERLRPALEIDLRVLVELILVHRHAGVTGRPG
jgi:hypothetical protein